MVAPRTRRRWRRILGIAVFGLLAWWLAGLLAAHLATRPHARPVAERRQLGGFPIESVATTTADGKVVRGWLARIAPESRRCVVLAAGIRGNRTAMVERAEWYLAHGWSTLLVDLRGTGESAPERIAMGWHEALDLCAWYAFLQQRGCTANAVHGQSLGAAAAVFSAVRGIPAPEWQFVVLESCYADVRAALAARLPWLPGPLLWPMVACSEWLLDLDVDDLDAVAAIRGLRVPTLLACGAADRLVGPGALARLTAASGAAEKLAVELPGLGHADLWQAQAFRAALAAFVAAR